MGSTDATECDASRDCRVPSNSPTGASDESQRRQAEDFRSGHPMYAVPCGALLRSGTYWHGQTHLAHIQRFRVALSIGLEPGAAGGHPRTPVFARLGHVPQQLLAVPGVLGIALKFANCPWLEFLRAGRKRLARAGLRSAWARARLCVQRGFMRPYPPCRGTTRGSGACRLPWGSGRGLLDHHPAPSGRAVPHPCAPQSRRLPRRFPCRRRVRPR